MNGHTLGQERRRYVRKSDLQVRVLVRDQYGRVSQGIVISLSVGGAAFITEAWPSTQLLEIRPENSVHWIRVTAKRCTSLPYGTIVRCTFPYPPSPQILQALSNS